MTTSALTADAARAELPADMRARLVLIPAGCSEGDKPAYLMVLARGTAGLRQGELVALE